MVTGSIKTEIQVLSGRVDVLQIDLQSLRIVTHDSLEQLRGRVESRFVEILEPSSD